ncbi:MAG: hypothetical protein N2512_00265 [Armatimonadetes bacterium]|nr:hypothetical protein [Armatimonadota bacterium]
MREVVCEETTMLKVGLATVDITPPLGVEIIGYFERRVADDVRDPLEAVAMFVDNGDSQVAIVILDLIMLHRQDVERLRARAAELTGIRPENLLVACTHTHQGPATATLFNTSREEEYVRWAMEAAADAVLLAKQRVRPVMMGHASGRCPEVSHNRRWHLRDGTVVMHPTPGSPERVRPAAPDDPELILVGFADLGDRGPVWALVNFALHYVGTPAVNTITADYSGVLRRELARMMGRDFRAIYANGTCGDIFWIDTDKPPPEHPTPFFHIERVGRLLAAEAYRQWQNIVDWTTEAQVGAAWAEVPFCRRRPTPEQMKEAKKLLAGPPDPANQEWVYANELVRLEQEPEERMVPIQAMRIGDVGIVGLPGEVFVEIGLAIKRQSPFVRTVIAELANDWAGYIPTDVALREGSYETRLATVSKAPPGTAQLWIDTAVGLLKKLAG